MLRNNSAVIEKALILSHRLVVDRSMATRWKVNEAGAAMGLPVWFVRQPRFGGRWERIFRIFSATLGWT